MERPFQAAWSDPGVRDFSRLGLRPGARDLLRPCVIGLCPPYSINAGSQAPDPDHPNVPETTAVRATRLGDDECGPLAHERNPGNRPSIDATLRLSTKNKQILGPSLVHPGEFP